MKIEFFFSEAKQLNRIYDKVECYATGENGDVSMISTIPKNNWEYFMIDVKMKTAWNFKADNVTLTAEVEDTGVYVQYIFKYINDKWQLIKIIDSST